MTGKNPKRPRDANQLAKKIVDLATGAEVEDCPPPESEQSAAIRKGGMRGGKARAAALSPAERKKIAAKAAGARWGKSGQKQNNDVE